MLQQAFAPLTGGTGLVNTANLAATTAAQNLTLPTPHVGANQIRVENHASDWAYCNFGPLATIAAATVLNSMGVAPGTVEVFSIDPSFTTASVILGSGTGTVRMTAGDGL